MSRRWSVADSRDLYEVSGWGAALFDIGPRGRAIVTTPAGTIDLEQVAGDCRRRGVRVPFLLRLPDVLSARIDQLCGTFADTIAAAGYQGRHRGVYPIKVNQQRHLVEELLAAGRRWHYGLEVGSKPELMLALALADDAEGLLIVNGYKDAELVEMALIGRRIGHDVVVVVEQLSELGHALAAGVRLGVPPVLGARVKLSATGAGRWSESSGERAKFGLSMHELLSMVAALRDADALDALTLLHFHIGSQVSAIRAVEEAVQEGARVYAALRQMGVPVSHLDVGGGLGVDYDGSRTDFESSMNYDVSEYAEVVVRTIQRVCDEAGVPHPHIVTESGRWVVAPSTVLVTSVLEAKTAPDKAPDHAVLAEPFASGRRMWHLIDDITIKNILATYHQASALRDEVQTRFRLGAATLAERASCDELYRVLLGAVVATASRAGIPLHEELAHLPRQLADIYFCNFSVFQSVPDAWAVGQLFPVMPLTRLADKPTRRAILADLTCDSDGKIDRFIDKRDVRTALEVHALNDAPYDIGVFMLGAYQETLGDLHNLFGDTHAVHVRACAGRPGYRIEHIIDGELVEDVIASMQYDRKELVAKLRRAIEAASERGDVSFELGSQLLETYMARMRAYTYLS